MKKPDINLIIFITILIIYVAAQFLIGTYHPTDKKFVFNAPADVDFLYYGAIINSLLNDFPPENPAFGGTRLTQPYFHYYPAAILAKLFNPYNSIRILNILYLILFAYVLYRLFPDRYGIALLILFTASTLFVDFNALGVDFIARGFTHIPFFILITLALFHKKQTVRLISVFVAALFNGYMMFMIVPFLFIELLLHRNKESLYLFLSSVIGLIFAGWIFSSDLIEKPFYFVFSESFYFEPFEMIEHAIPFLILAYLCRQRSMTILLIISLLFGSLVHYNPFFPVFIVYFSGAMILASGEVIIKRSETLIYLFMAFLFVGFIISAFDKYNPDKKNYFPRYDNRLNSAEEWISKNTDKEEIFAALTVDEREMALIMEYRPVYLGYVGHLAHLGINIRPRYNNITKLFRMNVIPDEVDYIFYGPLERRYFPGFYPPLQRVYSDSFIVIYRAGQAGR